MMKLISRSGIIAAVAAISPSCDDPAPAPPRPVQVIWIGEGYHWEFNAQPGDYIVVIMDNEGDMPARCDDMGGELILNPHTSIFMCEGVDF